jgi:hypothetical protein
MNRQIFQLHKDHQAKEQTGGAEEQSDRKKVMPVQAEKIREIYALQIRQHQVGFAATRVFLRVGENGHQKDQKSRYALALTL